LQVEPHVGFGGGFTAAVLRPVHAVGHQFHHGAIHHMNGHLETKSGTPAMALN
jgi:hypothetical protein